MKSILAKIGAHYDKLLAIVALLILVSSLVYLAVQVGMVNAREKEFNTKLSRIKIAHKEAPSVETEEFENAQTDVREPLTIDYSLWTNKHMLVLSKRVSCVDCKLPIPYESKVCTFCTTVQPVDEADRPGYDYDKDGIPDRDEIRLGLDPRDPTDALDDMDGDDYSNIAEFRAGTDLLDKMDFPPPEAELYVKRIVANPFKLRFKSVMSLPGGNKKFALNMQKGRGRVQTYFRKITEEVEGFTLAKYEEKYEERVIAKYGSKPKKFDVSELTLQRGEKSVVLIKGKNVQHDEYVVTLWFKLEDKEFVTEKDKEFELKGKKYQLKSIDSRNNSVVIVRLDDGESITIQMYDDAAERN